VLLLQPHHYTRGNHCGRGTCHILIQMNLRVYIFLFPFSTKSLEGPIHFVVTKGCFWLDHLWVDLLFGLGKCKQFVHYFSMFRTAKLQIVLVK
jgi:hypothetical protein